MAGRKGAHRLTAFEVIRARERRAAGDSLSAIAADFGVTASAICRATRGEMHKAVGGVRTRREGPDANDPHTNEATS